MLKKIIFLLALSAAILSGCVSVSSNNLRKDTAPDLKESALVLLPVTDRALFTATGVSFAVVDSNGGRHALTVDQWGSAIPTSDGRGSRYFGAFTLPAGEYKFVSWRLIETAGGAAAEPKEDMTFKLGKGDVVYLGNFNAIRPLASGQFRDRYEEDVKQYSAIYPWMKNQTVKNQQIKSTWWLLPGGKEPTY